MFISEHAQLVGLVAGDEDATEQNGDALDTLRNPNPLPTIRIPVVRAQERSCIMDDRRKSQTSRHGDYVLCSM